MATSNDKPYVFVSYAHADKEVVMPTINAMKAHNINIWYDGGIEAGSEWPEYIAEKVISCSRFILFISDAYLKSQNCKRELNFAISRKKEILSIYLHDVELSPGMEMQLGTYQAFFRNRFATNELFFAALCKEHLFDPCLEDTKNETASDGGNTTTSQNPLGGQSGFGNNGGSTAQAPQNGQGFNGGYGSPAPSGGYRNDIPYVPKSQRTNQGYNNGGYNNGGYNNNGYNNGGYNNQNNRGYGNNGGTYTPPGNQGSQGYNGGYGNPGQTPPVYTPPVYDVNRANLPVKSKIVAALLAIFLGGLGFHKFYLGKVGMGILHLLFCWTYIPGIISFIHGIMLLMMSDQDFERKYKCRSK